MASKQIKTLEFNKTAKFNLWFRYFSDKNNKECFGNATKSALKAYDTKNYASAGVIGHENLKKLKMLKLIWLDLEGYGFGERMKISLAKALKGSYSDWDKFMIQIGDFQEKPENIVNNNFDFSGNNLSDAIRKDRIERGLPI